MIPGWNLQYKKILNGFGYSRKKDRGSAIILDSILKRPISASKLKTLIFGKDVFVIGSGPSLKNSIPVLKKHKRIIKICADSALDFLTENMVRPEIVVTDLDGNLDLLKKVSKKSIMIVHAHGDNAEKLDHANNFPMCLGTTQGNTVGKIHNFGGFTDGDRCVFLASRFGARRIFLLGMDFGTKIGVYSNTEKQNRKTKLKKLQYGKKLLEWLAPKTKSDLFTLSSPLKGFRKITPIKLDEIISENGFNTAKT